MKQAATHAAHEGCSLSSHPCCPVCPGCQLGRCHLHHARLTFISRDLPQYASGQMQMSEAIALCSTCNILFFTIHIITADGLLSAAYLCRPVCLWRLCHLQAKKQICWMVVALRACAWYRAGGRLYEDCWVTWPIFMDMQQHARRAHKRKATLERREQACCALNALGTRWSCQTCNPRDFMCQLAVTYQGRLACMPTGTPPKGGCVDPSRCESWQAHCGMHTCNTLDTLAAGGARQACTNEQTSTTCLPELDDRVADFNTYVVQRIIAAAPCSCRPVPVASAAH